MTHQSKNLFNICNWLVRQVVSAYEYNRVAKVSRLKSNAHPNQIEAIAHFNSQIDEINRKRAKNHPAKVEKARLAHEAEAAGEKGEAKEFEPPKLKVLARLEPVMESSPLGAVLDPTVLDNAAKTRANENGDFVYRRIPAAMAQQVVRRLRECYSGYLQATKRFNADPTNMTGRPQMPDYLGKNDRFVVEMPFAQIYGPLPPLAGKSIPENDFAKEIKLLTPEIIKAFDGYDAKAAILDACRRRGWVGCQPQHLRIVPLRLGVRIEAVVRIANPYPAGSFLAGIVADYGKALAALKDDKARDAWLLDHLKALSSAALPSIAGMDLGKTNMLTVAYSTGNKAAVHTGGRFNAKLAIFTDLIADRVSTITPARARELQAKKEALGLADKKLDRNEEIELRALLRDVYADLEYRRLTGKKERWIKDYLHKISTKVVRDCVERNIDVIVIGQNKGWKQNVDIGREQNRAFCQIAHATLIDLIRYKAEARGMAVVTTEESYTSKSSFVNDDQLECYADKQTQDATTTLIKPVKSGKRSSVDRNWFHHKNRDDRWKWVHADVNGAFNIVRKVFQNFSYHAGLTLKFSLMRLSPRAGVAPLNL